MFSRWKEVRSKLTPGFTSGKLKLIYPLIQDVCNELLKHLREDRGEGKEREPLTVLSTSKVDGSSFSRLVTHSKYVLVLYYNILRDGETHVLFFAKSKKSVTRECVFVRVQLSTISRSVAEEEMGGGERSGATALGGRVKKGRQMKILN